MRITATFLDEISSDIPHQNWGYEDWEKDFQSMKNMGIDTVVLIRSGLERFITYPSEILTKEYGAYIPPVDLVDMFLELAEKYSMHFFFGTYSSHRNGASYDKVDFEQETKLDKRLAGEVWNRYGHRKAFQGWYLSKEISTNKKPIVNEFITLGRYCKELSGDLPVLISPGMRGRKANAPDWDFESHFQDWNEIMGRISGVVDIVAFQDGHVQFWELPEALRVNKSLADKHGLECWTNCESFDRDMPFRFPPIKWEKMLIKLTAAERAGIEKAITFEFSHFMSPNSFWPQAGNLYKRYLEYLKTLAKK